jgi:uncharacterized membrane protein
MESRTKLFGHGVHPMLIVFPLGLLSTAVVFDIISMATGNGFWSQMSFWMIAAGILGGILAAPLGAIDWLAIPSGTRASRVGFVHGVGNVFVLVLFAASWWLRRATPELPSLLAMCFSLVGLGAALVTAWFGGELVQRLGIGVDEGAHVDAPSSLTTRRTVRG